METKGPLMRWMIVPLVVSLSGCGGAVVPVENQGLNQDELVRALGSEEAVQKFEAVMQAIEPVAEKECRARLPAGANCDFLVLVDRDLTAMPNAFQSEDDSGRPVLTMTVGLLETVQNADELAFVMSHEASHHIADHLTRQQNNIEEAAETFGWLEVLTRGEDADVEVAQDLGAIVGAKAFSKSFELEADELGAIITYHAGYDPLIGALFFTRIPDPGDQFLSSHPPNAARLELVKQTVKQIKG